MYVHLWALHKGLVETDLEDPALGELPDELFGLLDPLAAADEDWPDLDLSDEMLDHVFDEDKEMAPCGMDDPEMEHWPRTEAGSADTPPQAHEQATAHSTKALSLARRHFSAARYFPKEEGDDTG